MALFKKVPLNIVLSFLLGLVPGGLLFSAAANMSENLEDEEDYGEVWVVDGDKDPYDLTTPEALDAQKREDAIADSTNVTKAIKSLDNTPIGKYLQENLSSQLHRLAAVPWFDLFHLLGKDLDYQRMVNFKDHAKHTPLHIAAYCNHKRHFVALVLAGADINAKDNDGNTPETYCDHLEDGRWIVDFVAMLREKMAEGKMSQAKAVHAIKKLGDFDRALSRWRAARTHRSTSPAGSGSASSESLSSGGD